MEIIGFLARYAGNICQIVTCAALLIRPIREKLMGTAQIREGEKCLLRSEIVRIYYRNKESKQLHEYEYKNMEQCCAAYKALGGNSFVDHIHAEMREWEII